MFKSRERFEFLRSREASRNAVESVWPVSYVVSRVTVFLTAQYFKARFVWKCLHSTCTAVGLAVVAFIRLSVYSFGALICSTHSLHPSPSSNLCLAHFELIPLLVSAFATEASSSLPFLVLLSVLLSDTVYCPRVRFL